MIMRKNIREIGDPDLQDKVLDNDITYSNFNDWMDKVNTETARIQNTLDGFEQETTSYKKYIKHIITML